MALSRRYPTGNARLTTSSPVPRPALLPGTDTRDRLRRAGLALTDVKPLGTVPSPLPPAPAETLAETVGPVPQQPRTRPLVLASSPPPSPPSSRRRGHRHDIVDRRLTDRPACFALPSAFSFFPILSFRPSLHPGWSTPGVWVSPPVGHSFLPCFSSASIRLSLGVYALFNVVITTPTHRRSIPLFSSSQRHPAGRLRHLSSSSSARRLFTSPVPMRPPPPKPSIFTPRQ